MQLEASATQDEEACRTEEQGKRSVLSTSWRQVRLIVATLPRPEVLEDLDGDRPAVSRLFGIQLSMRRRYQKQASNHPDASHRLVCSVSYRMQIQVARGEEASDKETTRAYNGQGTHKSTRGGRSIPQRRRAAGCQVRISQ
jgi:hypothetical protein